MLLPSIDYAVCVPLEALMTMAVLSTLLGCGSRDTKAERALDTLEATPYEIACERGAECGLSKYPAACDICMHALIDAHPELVEYVAEFRSLDCATLEDLVKGNAFMSECLATDLVVRW